MKFNLEKILRIGRRIIPAKFFKTCQPIYHWLLAFIAALLYRFPSRKIFVVGATGTKGKTSTIEIINAILTEAGYRTASVSSLRFKIDKESEKNQRKMTMPGRFFMQRFLSRAVKAGCQYAILEMTSEGAVQYRHKFIKLDAMIFTNLSPEHIESHGSFDNYRNAKLRFFKALEKSRAKKRIIIVNADDQNASYFLNFNVDERITFGLKDLSKYQIKKSGVSFTLDNVVINSRLSGEFNLYNLLCAIAFAKSQNIGMGTIKSAVEKFSGIEGRLENIDEGQDFKVVVDYAHTPDSLEKVYEIFQVSRKICVLGAAGGRRDKWKRPAMGRIASKHCDQVILTTEDPYDEDPQKIAEDITQGVSSGRCEIILDRREAIKKAFQYAKTGDCVIITGKGAEPWIMSKKGEKIPWDDREVCREELKKLQTNTRSI
jgi:UDP-N-acetylmuramoyl-L-alanyl-D-glutamate--2,6-diaminopimelate ligase